jgi:hypothetical protein
LGQVVSFALVPMHGWGELSQAKAADNKYRLVMHGHQKQ